MGKVANLYYDKDTLLTKKIKAPSLYPIEFDYNQKGLLKTITMGDRTTTYFLVPIVPDEIQIKD